MVEDRNGNINDILNLAINLSSNITIMGHRFVDLDSLGSSLGLLKYCLDLGKNARIIVNPNEYNQSVVKTVDMLDKDIKKHLINSNNEITVKDNSLLIVLDTFKSRGVENYELYNKFSNVIVLDHHEKNGDRLNPTVQFIKPDASSMVEIICDFFRDRDYSINDSTISTIMHTGMCIDTSNFDNNTSENTFLTAAYLMKNGASIRGKKSLFQERKEDIDNRNRLMKRSITVGENIMVCCLDQNIYSRDDLAKISDSLLKCDNITQAYTIGKVGTNKVYISARCFEEEDVSVIMDLLGGGGHRTAAAASLEKGISINKAKEMLLACITPSNTNELDINKKKEKQV